MTYSRHFSPLTYFTGKVFISTPRTPDRRTHRCKFNTARANELARSGDAGVGASCRHTHASGPHAHHTSSTVAGGTGKYCLLISHLSSHRIIISLVTNLPFTIPFTSPTSPLRAVLVGLVALSSTAVTPEAKMVLSAPRPPHPIYSSAASVAAPCVGAPGCHGFSPHQATWPTVQFRPLTKPGSPGFRQSHGAD